jgi:hypothetical protein
MAWRNIEIDHLIIGYLLTQDDDHASDQPLPTVSGVSDPGMLADTKASERPRVHQQSTRPAHELAGGAEGLTDTRQVI